MTVYCSSDHSKKFVSEITLGKRFNIETKPPPALKCPNQCASTSTLAKRHSTDVTAESETTRRITSYTITLCWWFTGILEAQPLIAVVSGAHTGGRSSILWALSNTNSAKGSITHMVCQKPATPAKRNAANRFGMFIYLWFGVWKIWTQNPAAKTAMKCVTPRAKAVLFGGFGPAQHAVGRPLPSPGQIDQSLSPCWFYNPWLIQGV